ncbi:MULTISPECIES: hypothetical protein [unclassified Mesorhizobium]|uniref:hypothetical protein n=1 Tax=unclassified Mesorhizobium TaxID=325217 RepID=UPI00333D8E60
MRRMSLTSELVALCIGRKPIRTGFVTRMAVSENMTIIVMFVEGFQRVAAKIDQLIKK